MNFFLLIVFVLSSFYSYAQNKLPIIRATSENVSIKDDGYLDKNAWTLSPKTKPDIYFADRSMQTKWVTFYTDIDSIKVKVKPGKIFNFIILLNNKDTCYTQIVSSKSIKNTLIQAENRHDTIPFILTDYSAIHVKGIINDSDTLNLHLDIGSLDFRLTKDAINKNLEKINKIQIGNLVWDNPNVQIANNVSHGMDGRFGWRVFDGKIVEIDYNKKLLIVHPYLPKKEKGYVKSKIKFIQSLFCIQATIKINNKNFTGDFLFDTGSDLAMVLDSVWTSSQKFPDTLKVINKSSFSDGAGRRYETSIVSVPMLDINGFTLNNIPTSRLGFASPVGFQMNYFGNDLLKRFNVIIDLQNDNIYLKPNYLYYLSYTEQKKSEK